MDFEKKLCVDTRTPTRPRRPPPEKHTDRVQDRGREKRNTHNTCRHAHVIVGQSDTHTHFILVFSESEAQINACNQNYFFCLKKLEFS